ncbi:MAG: beta-lactamase family protein [Blastocatellia bacterium]|nr:beta-lactamase family protein [Blastocatellia bacterium]
MKIKPFLSFALLVLLAASTAAQSTNSPLDDARLAQLKARMKSFVEQGRTAGIVTLLGYRGQVIHADAVGYQNLETKTPMRLDSLFQIASMTKPITAVAVLLAEEDGLLTVLDPVEKYLPEFKDLKVKEGNSLVKPTRPITIRDVLTHTSGMSGGYPEAVGDFLTFYRKRDKTLADAVKLFAQQPLDVQPGTKWIYSNTGIAVAGRIVEVVTKKSFEQFLQERLFTPLDMKDTHFFLPASKNARVAQIYQLNDSGLKKSIIEPMRENAIYSAPEAGLYSSAADLFRFLQMFLNGGGFKGKTILSRHSVGLLTANHTGELQAGWSPGMGMGLGFQVVRNIEGMFRLQSIGTFTHGGAWQTYYFVDPRKELIGVLLMQRQGGGGDTSDEFNAFVSMACASIY